MIDNGLVKLSGHHFHQAIGITDGANHHGFNLEIFGCDGNGAEIPEQICKISKPSIGKYLYRKYPYLANTIFGHIFFKQINYLLPKIADDDVIFFPNVNMDEILAIPRFIKYRKIKCRVVVRVIYTAPERYERKLIGGLKALLKHKNLKIVTSSLPYAKRLSKCGVLNEYIGGPPHTLPYSELSNANVLYEFAYLGQPAHAKGFYHLLDALIKGAERGFKPKAIIHCGILELDETLMLKLPHITFVKGIVSEHDFYKHLMSSKTIIIFYDLINYKLGDSSIVTESLALNRQVIASSMPFIRDTYGDEFFHDFCVKEYSADALLEKMVSVRNLSVIPISMIRSSEKARIISSPIRFVEKVLGKNIEFQNE